MVADLVTNLGDAPLGDVGVRAETFLRSQTAGGTYWPGDDELREGLRGENAYRRFKRGRLRMYLEAAEDYRRGYTGDSPSKAGARVPRVGYAIEHVLPQRWRAHWPVEGLAAQLDRDEHVHRLGNLTLLTGSLNSSVSNGPWLGAGGKRAKLDEHDVMLLNRDIREVGKQGWDEQLIDQRGDRLVDAFAATWPVPEGHVGQPEHTTAALDLPYVSVADLLVADLLQAGVRLTARPGPWGRVDCEVLPEGSLRLDGQVFASLSTAGHRVRQGSTNGWWFWSLPDGRRLKDVRAQYLAQRSIRPAGITTVDGLPTFDVAADASPMSAEDAARAADQE